ncbi:BNR repeat-containing protein [Sphingobium sp. 10 DY56-G10]|uniref:BNR repeat-containing protein n=1 Tax=Sphingobium sp. 10 DY56-G10 TaxID=2974918 RepID=UPI00352B4C00
MKFSLSLAAAGALVATGCASDARPNDLCEVPPPRQAGGALPIGQAWSGTIVPFGSAVNSDGRLVAAYYDAERYLTLATYDPEAERLCHKRLASRFAGWDAHNALTVAIDDAGIVHIAGNMHASPLVYARGPLDDLDAVRLQPMLGRNEASATYPQFMHDDHGNLLFLYRDGMSGNGSWLLNAWNGGKWQRIGELFADRDTKGPVNAYPTAFVKDGPERFHVAVVWRRTPDVATNFSLTYASTRDFRQWDVGGRRVNGPLSPETMEMVDAPGVQHGLVNNALLQISRSGEPVLLYTKFVDGQKSGVVAATRMNGAWREQTIVVGKTAVQVSGGGSMPGLPVFRFGETRSNGDMHVSAVIARDQTELLLDPDTLTAKPWRPDVGPNASRARAKLMPDVTLKIPKGMDKATVRKVQVRQNGLDGPIEGELRWFAQGVNQDRPHACTEQAPVACKPPASPLLWVPAPD